ncbi:MAG TPA: S9 family peptidase [Gemmatimonadales bacterium]|nr:S9 family peptidase [Gemmatimonadales bacterium]
MSCSRPFVSALALMLLFSSTLAAQDSLTLDRIFNSDEFASEQLGRVRWLENQAAYVRLEADSATPGGRSFVRYDAATGKREVWIPARRLVPPGDSMPLAVEDYSISPDRRRLLIFTNSQKVWRQNTRGDFWALDLSNWSLRKLGGAQAKPSTLMFAKFSPDGNRIAYVRENNLYVEDLGNGRITQLTHDGSRTIINGTFDWVYEEELNLRDGFRWSPDGAHIAYWQLDASGVRDFLLINNTDSLYSFTIPVQYPKAGTTNSAARVGVVSASGGNTVWLAVPGDPRNHYIAKLDWAGNSAEVVVQQLNRLQNTLAVMLGDARTGQVRTVHTERDNAWVDVVNDLRWLDGGKSFTWVSERDGYRHLYLISRDGKQQRLLTRGNFDLHNPASAFGEPFVVGQDSARGFIYYTASPENATQLYLFRSRIDGKGQAERLTPKNQPGYHRYFISSDGRWAIHNYSSFGTPPIVELVSLPEHKVMRTLVDNRRLRDAIAKLSRGRTEFVKLSAGPGLQLDAWVMKPPGFDSTRQYPVFFEVYGEPAAQTVLDIWKGEGYLWDLMLTQQGYVVAAIDNRGTPAPRGRAFRKVIYQKVGVVNVEDQAAALRTMRSWPWVDTTRIGVWGWSGGGSMTLHLMFRHPELYQTGMAVAPEADVRFYDTIYQERYLGLPQQSPDAYREASAVTYADKLRGNLLVVHGQGDDNVHYQATERLINALVAANRPFTMMEYPNRSHCICEGEGTTLHLFSLLTRYLEQNLPPGPRPATGESSPKATSSRTGQSQ